MNEGGRDEGGGDIHSEHGPDGLPRLPDHLAYGCHYEPKTHCPVCSLDEGEEHAAGERSSHAAAMLAEPPPLPPRRCGGMDESGVRLLQSLRRPRQPPSWWGSRRAHARCAHLLELPAMHLGIIALTLLDLGVVVTELILSSIYPVREEAPHPVHVAEEALSWVSISILIIFVAELAAKLAVFGHGYFTRSWWHLADAAVVIISLTLELTLKGVAQEVASLLVFFRLWRLLRIMHGVAEAMELNHEQELERHHRLVHGLQKDLAAEHRRVGQLEQEVAALCRAASGAGLDAAAILAEVVDSQSETLAGGDGVGRQPADWRNLQQREEHAGQQHQWDLLRGLDV
ncbi:hypothetical protein ABPG77_006842 [Micractinium sp. CCAP 211/92]